MFCWYLVSCQFLLCLVVGPHRQRSKASGFTGLWKRCTWTHELGRHKGVLQGIVWSGNPVVTGKNMFLRYDGLEKWFQMMDGKDRIDDFSFKCYVVRAKICSRVLKNICHGIPDIQGVTRCCSPWDLRHLPMEHPQLHPGTWAKDLAADQGSSTHTFSLAGVWCSWSLAIFLATLFNHLCKEVLPRNFGFVKSSGEVFFYNKCPTQFRFRRCFFELTQNAQGLEVT